MIISDRVETCLHQKTIKSGYNFLFIIDKKYNEFKKIIGNYEKENS